MAKKTAKKKSEPKPKPEGYTFGRPTKYKKEYCDELIEFMGKGFSYEAFAGKIGVSDVTLYEWEKTHEDFFRAKKEAFQKSRLFWESLAIENIMNKSDSWTNGNGGGESTSRSLNATVWIFNMKNRFKWRDKQPDESDVNVTVNLAERVAKARARAEKAKK